DRDGVQATGVGDQRFQAPAAGAGIQPQLACAVVHPHEAQHLVRIAAVEPLLLGHGVPPAAPSPDALESVYRSAATGPMRKEGQTVAGRNGKCGKEWVVGCDWGFAMTLLAGLVVIGLTVLAILRRVDVRLALLLGALLLGALAGDLLGIVRKFLTTF